MKNLGRMGRLPIAALLWTAWVFTGFANGAPIPEVPAKDRMVVVISLDGFPAHYLADPKLPAPTLRQLIATGSWAKEMTPIYPTWTWPNHTTLVTGLTPPDHGLLYNGTLLRSDGPLSVKIDPSGPKEQMVHCPTLYDIADRAGLTTAQVDWVAINQAPTITWAFPEQASASDALVKEMIAKGTIQPGDLGGKTNIVWRDQIWTEAGEYLIAAHRPNLLLFHLLTLDSTQHSYGPGTLAAFDAVAFLDTCVRSLIDAVKAAGMLERTTFFVVSDHGFRTVHKQIAVNQLLANASIGTTDAEVIPEGGSAMIYIAKNRRKELLAKLREIFSREEGLARVVGEEEYPKLRLPLPGKDPQMPDLIAIAKPDYAFSRGGLGPGPVVSNVENPIGAHGYPNEDPEMQAIFIASGYGIRRGVELDKIDNLAVAPTLARLLGITLPKSEEGVLTQILQ